jgi:hypothetical protein
MAMDAGDDLSLAGGRGPSHRRTRQSVPAQLPSDA